MPVLHEEALQTLICSSCKKYLTVFPVKVYPNKNVICGRCSDKKGGTTSRLYELVARQFEFPCINRFEGCRDVLPASVVEDHEVTCYGDEYACPICSDFNGSSYDLLYHMKIDHKAAALENPVFLIELDHGFSSEVYFYCKSDMLVVVRYQYDAHVHQLNLNLDTMGKLHVTQQNIMHKFMLYSVRNKLQYKTGNIRSAESRLDGDRGLTIDLTNRQFPKNIIFCKFQVWNPTVTLKQYHYNKMCAAVQCDLPQIIDGSANTALLKYTFDNVSNIVELEEIYSDFKYPVGDIFFQLVLQKKLVMGEINYLGVFLRRTHTDKKCKVNCTLTLISLTSLNFSRNFVKDNLPNSNWGYQEFITWYDLFDSTRGFVKNNSIEFHVLLEVLPFENGKCDKCQEVCSKCDENE